MGDGDGGGGSALIRTPLARLLIGQGGGFTPELTRVRIPLPGSEALSRAVVVLERVPCNDRDSPFESASLLGRGVRDRPDPFVDPICTFDHATQGVTDAIGQLRAPHALPVASSILAAVSRPAGAER